MKTIITLGIILIALNVSGQSIKLIGPNLIEFKGIVQDSLSIKIIPNANISLYQHNQLIKRAVSDQKGEFKVLLPKGNYAFIVSCMGYNTKYGSTDSAKGNNSGNEIRLSEATNITSEVVIKTKKNNIGSIHCQQIFKCSDCNFTYKPYNWLVINPSNYMSGPFLVPPKEKK